MISEETDKIIKVLFKSIFINYEETKGRYFIFDYVYSSKVLDYKRLERNNAKIGLNVLYNKNKKQKNILPSFQNTTHVINIAVN